MIYLVDTDVIIDFLKNQKPAIDLFNKINSELIKISVITFLEIEYGIKKSYHPEKKKEEFINFMSEFSIEIIAISPTIAEEFVKLKINLEKQRQPLADFDLFIAATAIANNLSLVTRNIKHFKRIKDLKLH
ncbi:MAG: PIN domain protein [Candidatus Levybacteria bacterium GW2011_GWA2_37_36]|uniref:PIN domain protein n=1 Tax=Candidatus Roizmanbacteria bacterium GW2011_GWC2_34_23 TaxID=1618484 RepID=A0A0G0DIG3_9BACT|nr:MAG: PIN domain protein [Candidatus Roizmanbacteria bacterium GW2011_GWC2_34_23]KKQ32397.1 MAG: PIN domain protein [Candidatus Levybacteria bacterium GW2011_GWA2_37_36]